MYICLFGGHVVTLYGESHNKDLLLEVKFKLLNNYETINGTAVNKLYSKCTNLPHHHF